MLECNMLENAGSDKRSASTVRDQTKNVTCHVKRTPVEPVVLAGETAFLS